MRNSLRQKIGTQNNQVLPLVCAVEIDRSKMRILTTRDHVYKNLYKYADIVKQLSNGHTLIKSPQALSGNCVNCLRIFKVENITTTFCSFCRGNVWSCERCFDKNHRVVAKKPEIKIQ
jgi:rRNA maturation endonuclease Nob1